MTELKTLKEIELCDWGINDNSAKEILKAEAVKWIKDIIAKENERVDNVTGTTPVVGIITTASSALGEWEYNVVCKSNLALSYKP